MTKLPIISVIIINLLFVQQALPTISLEKLNIISFTPANTNSQEPAQAASIRTIIEQIPQNKTIDTTLDIKKKRFAIKNQIPMLKNHDDTVFVYCHGWIGNIFGHP